MNSDGTTRTTTAAHVSSSSNSEERGGTTTETTTLLREWSHHHPTTTPPVAPAVPVLHQQQQQQEQQDEADEAAELRPSYSYPVATFVRDLVRNGIDQIYSPQQQQQNSLQPQDSEATLPLSFRSEPHTVSATLHDDDRPQLQEHAVSANAVNDMEDAEFILVDGDLIVLPPHAPNQAEQEELEYQLRHQSRPKACQHHHRVRRGVVKKLGKLFKRRHAKRASSKEASQLQQQQAPDELQQARSIDQSVASRATSPTNASPKRRSRRNKAKLWRRSDSQNEANVSDEEFYDETSSSSLHQASIRSGGNLSIRSAGSLDIPPAAAAASAPVPQMSSIEEETRQSSVTASFVGTEDQFLLEAGVLPAAAEAIIEEDYLKKEEGLVASVVPADADYKVDKADAPDVESMLLRAAHETTTDLEASEFSPAPVVKRGKSDGSSVPLSMAHAGDKLVHNDMLKVVMVGSPGADKSMLARSIRQSTKRPRKRMTLGIEVQAWRPADVKFMIWDVQGATTRDDSSANFGAHSGTQSLFFSSQCLYLLVWDMACSNRHALRQEASVVSDDHDADSDSDEDEDCDDFYREEANRQADRALFADIQNRVLAWVDYIARRGQRSAILPVAVIPEDMSESEIKRRCDMMYSALDEHNLRYSGIEDAPKFLMAADDNVFCVDYARGFGVEQLRQTMMDIATDNSRSVFEHVGTPVPPGTVKVLDAIRHFKQDHKLVLLDHLIGELGTELKVDEITNALHFLSNIGEILYFGTADDEVLSRYVILNRKWLVSALSCILRNDLKRELNETRRFMNMQCIYSDQQFPENEITKTLNSGAASSCPLLSDNDANMLWHSMTFMREAADHYARLTESTTTAPTMFYFLERLLVHSGIFLPLGVSTSPGSLDRSQVFFVPSLMGQADPRDVWTYKSSESWMTTLCHSWLFRDGAPSDLMEHVAVSLLKDLYEFSRDFQGVPPRDHLRQSSTDPLEQSSLHQFVEDHENQPIGRIRIHQIMCWKTFMLVKIGTVFADHDSRELRESFVEVFVAIVDQSSSLCVAADAMRGSMQRVVVSGKGQVGNHGRKLWKGGYKKVLDSVAASLDIYANVDSQAVCPECLAHSDPRSARTWSWDSVLAERAVSPRIRCMRGHGVDSNLICGSRRHPDTPPPPLPGPEKVSKNVSEMLPSVVLVGLWDANLKVIRSVGSGFVVDKKLGLVVTAGHVLFNMEEGRQFGTPYKGIQDAKVVIGVIPDDTHEAVFRYFAEIVMDDIHNVDACVIRIKTRMENDVDDEGAGCANQPETPLNYEAVQSEKLKSLKTTNRFEIEESVRILGFNQGGEGILEEGKHVNRVADFAKGYICKKFTPAMSDDSSSHSSDSNSVGTFSPREEIVIMCPTISGHSGGPCVNDEGKVVGVLSRADPADRQRCYLVPSTEIKTLVSKAKKVCMRPGPITHMQTI